MHSWPAERAEGFSSPACAQTSLLLARRPSLWTPLGVILVASCTVLSPLRDRAASDQDPGHHTVTYGVVAARRPPMDVNSQPRTYRNLCCTWYGSYMPAWHGTFGDVALLTWQARGGVRQVHHLKGTKVAVFPPHKKDQQRSGLAVTEVWRPGRRRATLLPEMEQATQCDELSG